MIRLGLLRHGHTEWNRAGRIQGRTDQPLDDEARAHLRTFQLPNAWEKAQVVSSPLQRASDTAHLVTGEEPTVAPALIEMDWGAWEGAQGAVLRSDPNSGYRDVEHWGWDYRPPGGESPADLRARLIPWTNELQRDTVAICHIGVMRVVLAHATGWNFDGPAPFRIKRNRLFVLHIADGNWQFVGTERLAEVTP